MIEASQQVPAIFEPSPQEIKNDWWPPGWKTVHCVYKHDLGPALFTQNVINGFGENFQDNSSVSQEQSIKFW